jgi:heme-degrading monooxygenase HmoA
MFVQLVIHRPQPGQEAPLLDSMGRACAALSGCPGLLRVARLRDRAAGALLGLALWESEAAWQAGVGALRAAVKDDPLDEWLAEPLEVFLLDEI